ncbi:hypothetical protein [Rhodococcoides fascians]|uniref:hypothetical protein n=1 Tax=Rhodococcoides fascians TaxID=1828 RepID=UPI0007ABD564|nr:hypothetical protein [Rhodococcus fascians]OZC38436.1 hypothetical protein CHX23_20495 [Rhodococcus fascians]
MAKEPRFRTEGINGARSIRFDGGDLLRTAPTLVLGNRHTICLVAVSTATPSDVQAALGVSTIHRSRR